MATFLVPVYLLYFAEWFDRQRATGAANPVFDLITSLFLVRF
jgi:hypothetical protein